MKRKRPISSANLKVRENLEVYQFINEADLVPRCMSVGAVWCPSVIEFFEDLKANNEKIRFLVGVSDLFKKVLSELSQDLQEYGLFGNVRIIDDGGVVHKLTERKRLVDIMKKALELDATTSIKYHFMDVYKERLRTQFEGLPLILDEDKARKAHIPNYL